MNIKDICEKHNIGQTELSKRFDIPLRTVQDWCAGRRKPPEYLVKMMDELLEVRKMKKYGVYLIENMEYTTETKAIGEYEKEAELRKAIRNADMIDCDPELVEEFEAENLSKAMKIAYEKGYQSTADYKGYTLGKLIEGDFYFLSTTYSNDDAGCFNYIPLSEETYEDSGLKANTIREEAIENHRKMWNWLAENPGEKQEDYLKEFDPEESDVFEDCYICRYVKYYCYDDCGFCPLKWTIGCCEMSGLLSYWQLAMDDKDYPTAAEIAKQIAELPEKDI